MLVKTKSEVTTITITLTKEEARELSDYLGESENGSHTLYALYDELSDLLEGCE